MPDQVNPQQRFTRQRPCPACGGHDRAPRSKGDRCWGFLSEDGSFAHCTRSEYAGGLQMNLNSETYPHRLVGECGCGHHHGGDSSEPGAGLSKQIEVALYDYSISMDVLPYQVVRYEPKDFKVRRPDEKGGLVWNRKGVQLILYRLPELLAAALEKLVFITEGEKDADRLTVLGLVATTNPFGAGKFHLIKNLVPLRGRRVVVLPDNDRDGRNHAQDVANRLQGV